MERTLSISARSAATIILLSSELDLILNEGITEESIEELTALQAELEDVVTELSERNDHNEEIRPSQAYCGIPNPYNADFGA